MALAAAALMVSCDPPQGMALRNLAKAGVSPSGRALLDSVTQRDKRLVALLLEAGVYTEQRDGRGHTPLAIAVGQRDVPTVIMLLNARANVNATLGGPGGILGLAAGHGDSSLFQLLLAAGASVEGLMEDGERILPWAIRQGRGDLVEILMKADSDPHLKDSQGNPLLHIAMEAGRRELMESLIDLGAEPASANAAGETTLHLALRQGWRDLLPKLVAAGADPNAPGPDGRTLLEQAVAAADLNEIRFFLRLGADPHFRHGAEDAPSPLQSAFQSPNAGLFECFMRHGITPPEGGWDPWLMQAIEGGNFTKIRLLLSHGACARLRGTDGRLPVEAAALAGRTSLVKLLLDYGCPPGAALYQTSVRGDHDLLGVMLACGLSPDFTRFPTPDTAFSTALRLRHDRVAALLVRHGANVSHRLPEGQSAFHLAVATTCHRTVNQLLAAGANPNAPFNLPVSPDFLRIVRPGVMRWILNMDRNATPLMMAADSGCIQTTRSLIEGGAKMNVRTRLAALWPINFAARRNDVRMMRLFFGRDPWQEERIIEVRIAGQQARVLDAAGNELLVTKVSTGRRGYETPTGEFVITNKHRDWTSTLYHAGMPYFLRLSCGDFGLHQGRVPGYPASHGCIRVPAGNAARLFSMTQTGDRVRILP